MTTAYPTGLDAFGNPVGTDLRTNPDHAAQHANANDAIEALEAKVGVNSSGVTSSLDNQMEGHAHTAGADDGGAIAHSVLTGLTNDEHTQYVKETERLIVADFSKAGAQVVAAGTFRWYNDSGLTLTFRKARVSAGVAPTGAALIVDINKNATTIFSTQSNRPQIAAAANTGTTVTFNTTTIADGEYLTVDIDQIGSTVAGSDLTVQVWMSLA